MGATGARCHYCGEAAGTTRDHIVAKSWGGRGMGNLVPACGPCNNSKAANAPTCPCTICTAAVLRWLRQARPVLESLEVGSPRWRHLADQITTLEGTYTGAAGLYARAPLAVG